MADYREMYLTMVRATERAMEVLIEAQQKAEECYLETEEGKVPPAAAEETSPK